MTAAAQQRIRGGRFGFSEAREAARGSIGATELEDAFRGCNDGTVIILSEHVCYGEDSRRFAELAHLLKGDDIRITGPARGERL